MGMLYKATVIFDKLFPADIEYNKGLLNKLACSLRLGNPSLNGGK